MLTHVVAPLGFEGERLDEENDRRTGPAFRQEPGAALRYPRDLRNYFPNLVSVAPWTTLVMNALSTKSGEQCGNLAVEEKVVV